MVASKHTALGFIFLTVAHQYEHYCNMLWAFTRQYDIYPIFDYDLMVTIVEPKNLAL